MNLRWIPNAVTISRMVMALPLLGLLLERNYRWAFWLAVVAGLSDALDGYLAKRFDCRSVLGGVLDPIADKLLLGVCFFGLWWQFHLPGWLLALVLIRDSLILVGALLWWRRIGNFEPSPSRLSKANTVSQIALAAGLLADLAVWRLPDVLLGALMVAMAGLTVASGADYLGRYGARVLRSGP